MFGSGNDDTRKINPFSGKWALVLLFCATGALALSLYFLDNLLSPTQPTQPAPAGETDRTAGTPFGVEDPSAADADARAQGVQYEDELGDDLDLRIREIDLALVQTVLETGLSPDKLVHEDIVLKVSHGTNYHFQTLSVATYPKGEKFIKNLKNALKQLVPEARLVNAWRQGADEEWLISFTFQPTHRLWIRNGPEHSGQVARKSQDKPRETALVPPKDVAPPEEKPKTPAGGLPPRAALPAPLPSEGRLVLIIDDLGHNYGFAEQLASLDFPVTFSVLPHLKGSRPTANLAAKRGLDVLLHLPMETGKTNPGPGSLFLNYDNDRIRAIVASNLAEFPSAIGANNHMGSVFTQNKEKMEVVIDTLSNKGVFFLDSLTTIKSSAYKASLAVNRPILRRDVFLDHVPKLESVLFQLRTAERLALRQGTAIAIGHPHQATLTALRIWSAQKDARVKVVPIREVMPKTGIAVRQDKKNEESP